MLILFGLSLGAVLLVSRREAASATLVSTPTPSPTTTIVPPPATPAPAVKAGARTPTQLIASTIPSTALPMASPEPSATTAPTVTLPSPTVLTPSESIVTAPSIFVYDGPSTNNSIIGGMQRDDKVVILGSSGTWYLIRVSSTNSPRSRIEGGRGWITQDVVTPPSQALPVITP